MQTAKGLAIALGATLASSIDEPIDLLVAGSRPEAPEGRVMMSASVEYAIENAFSPVLVAPRGVVLGFGAPSHDLATA